MFVVVCAMNPNNSCGITAELLNGNYFTTHKHIELYNFRPTCQPVNRDQLTTIRHLLNKYHKLIVNVDVAGWFDHVFTLYNTDSGITITDSFKYNYDVNSRPFDLDGFINLLLSVNDYVSTDPDWDIDYVKFDKFSRLWTEFWNVRRITGSRGSLDYYNIDLYHEN